MQARWRSVSSATVSVLMLLLSSGASASSEVTEVMTETYSLSSDGRITLDNINGDVAIEAWDQDEVFVEAVKRASSQSRLESIRVEFESSPSRLSISTDYEKTMSSWTGSASVDFTLKVPATLRLSEIDVVNGDLLISGLDGEVEASSVNGELIAEDLGGKVDLSTVNGSLEASFDELVERRSVDISSVNGRVSVTFPTDSDVEIEASTVHGPITSDFGEVERGRYVGRTLETTLGRGNARLNIDNVNGSITLRQ